MKEKKIYKVSYNNKEYCCFNLSAVRDLIAELDIPIKDWQLWKLPKEMGVPTTIFNVTITAVPMRMHTNPNKGRKRKAD